MCRWTPLALLLLSAPFGWAQSPAPLPPSPPLSPAIYTQTAHILGLDPLVQKLSALQAQRACNTTASLEELTTRQQLLEDVQAATLDVDSVLAEIANEEGQLSNLRTSLQAKRDRTVAKLNTAALITGSAAGAAVSATQFNTLGSRTNNIGDGFGIGSGVASTVLSVLAAKKQNGPSGTVGEVPNMLAPLFDATPVLNTYYPPAVFNYLQAVPANEDPSRGTRLEQLKAEWGKSGRLTASTSTPADGQLAALTSSANPKVKISIDDLTNRIGMLVDVSAKVSLMHRDLATLMRSWTAMPASCTPAPLN